MTPQEYGEWLADQAEPLTDEQIDQAAHILAQRGPLWSGHAPAPI